MSLAELRRDGRTLIVVNKNASKRGALSPDLYDALNAALIAAKDPQYRAILLTSEGNFFCSGGDLNAMRERKDLSLEARRDKLQELHDIVTGLRAVPIPVIAAVEGGAAGAGLSLALTADMLIASEGATFTASYVKAGVVPDGGLTSALARMLPRQLVSEMCLLAQTVPAERLAALGVVNAVVPQGGTLEAAHVLAARFAQGPREAQGTIKRLVSAAYETPQAAQLDLEREAMIRALADTEAQIGINAFLNKEAPKYP